MESLVNQQVVISHPRTASRYVAEQLGLLTNAVMQPHHNNIILGRDVSAQQELVGNSFYVLHTHFHSLDDYTQLIETPNVVFTEVVRDVRDRFMSGLVVQATGLVNSQKVPTHIPLRTAHNTVKLMLHFEDRRQQFMAQVPKDRYRQLRYQDISTRPATDYYSIDNWGELLDIFLESELNTP